MLLMLRACFLFALVSSATTRSTYSKIKTRV